jgi:hypothetical protein
MKRDWATLHQLSRDQLIAEYDREAKNVGTWSLAFIRDEIFHREVETQGNRMEAMTRQMASLTDHIRWLTIGIAVLTAVSTAAVIFSVWRGR